MASRKEVKVGVKKKKGILYSVASGGAIKAHNPSTKKTEVVAKAPAFKRQKDRLYFVDKAGDISSAPMNRKGRPVGSTNGRSAGRKPSASTAKSKRTRKSRKSAR